ncbi:M48 family metallopeptidase [Seleniivibrio woodruffii]|uniref:tetratricopeptide repeat protein n=1 Tax=Seleniivibrio woodruffii TaxID=1078050 RepID=UPI0026EE8C71|nr:tetratricopeptide repeat protein [Seleniivibrio woodruffii]
MYTLAVSVAISTALALILYFLTYSIFWPIFLFVVGVLGINFFVGKKFMNKLTDHFKMVEKDLTAGRADKAIEKLKEAYPYGKWQFFVKEQIDAQIGIILYTNQKFDEAEPYLNNGFTKNWMSMAMLAALRFKEGNFEQCCKIMDKAIKGSPKQGFLYSLYAHFLMEKGDNDKAVVILSKGADKNPLDERLQSAMEAVKNGKKLKMQNYGNLWLQMHLGAKMPQGAKPYQQFLANQRMGKRR